MAGVNEIRRTFLDYFAANDHDDRRIQSAGAAE